MMNLRKLAKAVLLCLFTLGAVFGCQSLRNSGEQALMPAANDALRIATYNVHYINMNEESGPWSRGDWDRRKAPLDMAFKTVGADIMSFQEMESFRRDDESGENLTLDWLLSQNPDYAAAAVGDPAAFPSTQPILYRKARLEVLDQGWFFFSDTPDVIYSRTFNGSYPAFASWTQFRDRATGAILRVINVHTDFGSRTNRIATAELVAARMNPWISGGETVILAGDLNAREGDRVLRTLETAGLGFAPVSGATYHFNRGINLFGAIDHIGFTPDVTPAAPTVVLRQKFAGEWPTDHYPIIADLTVDH